MKISNEVIESLRKKINDLGGKINSEDASDNIVRFFKKGERIGYLKI